jgi:hypothetical protein
MAGSDVALAPDGSDVARIDVLAACLAPSDIP